MNYTKARPRTATTDFEYLVNLRDTGSEAPIFCIHPSGGDVGVYRKLARCLRDHTSIGIQSQMNCGSPIEHRSVSEMAKTYAQVIDQRQMEGPIRLLGFSFGGFIANSIASHLAELDREVSFLGLIDSDLCWIFEESTIRRDLTERLEQVSLNFRNGGFLKKFPVDKIKRDVATIVDNCLAGMAPELVARQLTEMGHVAVIQSDFAKFENFVLRFTTHCQLINAYRPSPMDMPVHLWWPADGGAQQELRSQYWRNFSSGELSQSVVGESHYAMMKMPHAKKLAAEIAVALTLADDAYKLRN